MNRSETAGIVIPAVLFCNFCKAEKQFYIKQDLHTFKQNMHGINEILLIE
ncbi:MAG: hypothetical protein IKE15_03740 [Clostridia bacterium]|nr:hypothetical protein [Clostridia bacterium]